jgi:hypothetical protein
MINRLCALRRRVFGCDRLFPACVLLPRYGMAVSEYHKWGMPPPTNVVTRKPFHLVIPVARYWGIN